MKASVRIKATVKNAVGLTPFWQLAGLVRRGGCAVLTYHRVGRNRNGFKHITADTFRAQMLWLREHCSVVSPDAFHDACASRDRIRPRVLVTFDDGYRDYHDVAYPILRELRIPAINFVVSGFVDRPDRLFWWDQVDLAIWACQRPYMTAFWRGSERLALDAAGRESARMDIRRYIWGQPHHEREGTIGRWCDELGWRPAELQVDRQVMSWDEIRAVSDLTTVGAHTHTHPLLSRIDEPELQREIVTCRDRITTEVSRPATFAYPSGAVSGAARRVLQQEGFTMAFAGARGVNDASADWFEIKRINAPASVEQLAYLLSGIPARFAA